MPPANAAHDTTQLSFAPAPATARDAALEWNPSIKDLPAAERPVNRLYHAGIGALSTTEILAVLIGTPHALDDARQMLTACEGNLTYMIRHGPHALQKQPGIGHVTAARIAAALELGRRSILERDPDRFVVRAPADVAQLLMAEMSPLEQEHFRVILLDTRNRVLDTPTIYIGTLNASHIRIGEVFKHAITRNAAAIIACHNHPSGDPTPSPEDVEVTRQIAAAGDLLDIELLDHLIIGHQRFVSLKERGLGFT